jgi:hypothetical protein
MIEFGNGLVTDLVVPAQAWTTSTGESAPRETTCRGFLALSETIVSSRSFRGGCSSGSGCDYAHRARGRAVRSRQPRGRVRRHRASDGASGLACSAYAGQSRSYSDATAKPSSRQPVWPPAMIFAGLSRRASCKASPVAPLQCGPARYVANSVSSGHPASSTR